MSFLTWGLWGQIAMLALIGVTVHVLLTEIKARRSS